MDEDSVSGQEQRQRLRAEGIVMTASKVTGPWW